MAKIVNLKRARKARTRAASEAKAAENRVRFGTPKALLKPNKTRAAKEKRDLEARRLEPGNDRPN
jgi:hypothetical protein